MARKIIKAILFILAAVVVAGGIMTYLRSQKKVTSQPIATTPGTTQQPVAKKSEISNVAVNAQGSSAQVQIKGINEHNYNIERIASGEGFKILVPNAQIEQIVKPVMDKPHPLIKKISVHPSATNPGMAELVFETEKDVNFLDTHKNDTLTIDFIKSEASGDQKPTVAGRDEPAAGSTNVNKSKAGKPSTSTSDMSGLGSSSKTSSAKASKATAAAKKKSAAAARTAAKSKKGKKASSVKLKPFVDDSSSEFGDLDTQDAGGLAPDEQGSMDQLQNTPSTGMNDFGSAPTTEPMQDEAAPTIAEPSAPKKNTDAEDGFMNLNDTVKEETKPVPPAGNVNLLDAETQMSLNENMGKAPDQKMAAIPNQKFDVNALKANLPSLNNMTVTRSGNNTVVTFDREKSIPYKIFRMVNPSRVVVDFKDAKSKLKSDYPRFAGTKISRIETREYGSADGLLIRVIMYVDGAPNFTSNKNGNQLVVELQ